MTPIGGRADEFSSYHQSVSASGNTGRDGCLRARLLDGDSPHYNNSCGDCDKLLPHLLQVLGE
jgi:hypothetical protein